MDKIVISLCDLTGNMVRPWAEAGYDCFCVDIQHGIRNDEVLKFDSGGSITFTWGDARSWFPLDQRSIKILFAFPPCTDLAVSGARDFIKKAGYRLSDALELFDSCQLAGAYSRAPYMIENPVSRLSSHKRKPDYIFDPYEYGGYCDPATDQYTKKTCLWTGNGFIMPEKKPVDVLVDNFIRDLSPSDDRQNIRSATPMGFAKAVFEANK